MTRLIDADALIEKANEKKPIGRFTLVEYLKNAPTVKPEITEEQAIDKLHETGWLLNHDKEMTDRPQKVVTIPHELIEKLVLCVVDTVENIDWDKAIEAYKERPTGKWIDHQGLFFECTICKYKTAYGGNYCPYCGAKMDGGEE